MRNDPPIGTDSPKQLMEKNGHIPPPKVKPTDPIDIHDRSLVVPIKQLTSFAEVYGEILKHAFNHQLLTMFEKLTTYLNNLSDEALIYFFEEGHLIIDGNWETEDLLKMMTKTGEFEGWSMFRKMVSLCGWDIEVQRSSVMFSPVATYKLRSTNAPFYQELLRRPGDVEKRANGLRAIMDCPDNAKSIRKAMSEITSVIEMLTPWELETYVNHGLIMMKRYVGLTEPQVRVVNLILRKAGYKQFRQYSETWEIQLNNYADDTVKDGALAIMVTGASLMYKSVLDGTNVGTIEAPQPEPEKAVDGAVNGYPKIEMKTDILTEEQKLQVKAQEQRGELPYCVVPPLNDIQGLPASLKIMALFKDKGDRSRVAIECKECGHIGVDYLDDVKASRVSCAMCDKLSMEQKNAVPYVGDPRYKILFVEPYIGDPIMHLECVHCRDKFNAHLSTLNAGKAKCGLCY